MRNYSLSIRYSNTYGLFYILKWRGDTFSPHFRKWRQCSGVLFSRCDDKTEYFFGIGIDFYFPIIRIEVLVVKCHDNCLVRSIDIGVIGNSVS